ncbi:hypothetical protein Tco_0675614, partial [Tanacetum coccineum]
DCEELSGAALVDRQVNYGADLDRRGYLLAVSRSKFAYASKDPVGFCARAPRSRPMCTFSTPRFTCLEFVLATLQPHLPTCLRVIRDGEDGKMDTPAQREFLRLLSCLGRVIGVLLISVVVLPTVSARTWELGGGFLLSSGWKVEPV